jgi:hypothetical protein
VRCVPVGIPSLIKPWPMEVNLNLQSIIEHLRVMITLVRRTKSKLRYARGAKRVRPTNHLIVNTVYTQLSLDLLIFLS